MLATEKTTKVGEPFDTFATDLRNLISTCEYHVDERDNLLRDQIVLGVLGNTSDAVREKLFYADGGEMKLTLPIAVDIPYSSGQNTTNTFIRCAHIPSTFATNM